MSDLFDTPDDLPQNTGRQTIKQTAKATEPAPSPAAEPPLSREQIEREITLVLDLLIGGGVIAYQRGLARAVGDHSAGLLLSQFWHWTQRIGPERNGWFFKSQEDIEEELIMTRREQETARRKLRELGLLEEKRVGMPARLWFRIDRIAVARMLRVTASDERGGGFANQYGGNRQSSMAETANQEWMKAPIKNGANVQTSLAQTAGHDCTDQPNKIGANRPTISKRTAEITAQRTTKTKTATADLRASAAAESSAYAGGELPTEVDSSAITALVEELVSAGVNRADALRLATSRTDECRRQLGYLPHVTEFTSSRGAYLRTAIERGFAPPKAWQAAREAEEQRQTRERSAQSSAEAAAQRARAAEESAARLALERNRIQTDEPERWAQIVAEAERQLPPPLRGKTSHVAYGPALLGNIDRIVAGEVGG